MPTSRLRQLLKFMRVFGIAGGIRLWCALHFQLMRGANPLHLHVPGMRAPIQLRPRDLPIFWQIMVMRENDFDALPQAASVQARYKQIQSQGFRPVVVDCGGHVGLSAVWFASRFPEATVYSIEPDSSNYAMLRKNTEPYPNVIALNGGIWGKPCSLEISNPNSGSASFRLREDAGATGTHSLRGYTVDEILAMDPQNRAVLVKVDIEGAEADLFREPADWFESTFMVVIELHDWLMPGQGTSRNFFRRLGETSFEVVLSGENLLLFRAADRADSPEQLSERNISVAQA